jgi:probable rRNA maturation factor
MTVAVDVVDATGSVAGHGAVRGLVEAVLAAEGLPGQVAVAFVDEAVITDLNRRYRDAEGPTDVLSFDYSAEDSAGAGWPGGEAADEPGLAGSGAVAGEAVVAGEIAVCPQVVIRYAAEEGQDPIIQLGWTLIHGVLHLAGYDHETDQGEMREREQELLRRLSGRVGMLALAKDRE